MQNAQLNKQWWTTEKKQKQTFVEVFARLVGHKKTLQNGQIYRRMTKKSETVIFFLFSVLTCFLQNLSLTSKWVFTQCTQNSRDRKRWREQRAETSRSWQLLYTKLFLWEMMWRLLLLCCCCSNNTISTTILTPTRNTPGQSSRISWNQPCSIINYRYKMSPFPPWHSLLLHSIFLS